MTASEVPKSARLRTLPATVPGQRGLLASIAIDNAGVGLFSGLSLIFLVERNHVPAAVAGAGVTAGSLLAFAAIPLCGRTVQRVGSLRALQQSNLLTAVGYLLFFLSHSLPLILSAVLLTMVADQLYGAGWPTALARVAGTPEELTTWFTFTNTVRTLFVGLGSMASTMVLAVDGTSGLSYVLSGNIVSCFGSVAALHTVRLPPAVPREQTQSRSTVLTALRDRRFMAFAGSQTMISAAWIMPTVAFPLLLVERLHAGAFWGAAVIAVRYAVVSATQMPARRLLSIWSRNRTLTISVLLIAAGCGSATLMSATVGTVAGSFALLGTMFIASAETLVKPAASTFALQLAPAGDEAPHMAIFQVTWKFAYAIGPLVVGIGLAAPVVMWASIASTVAAGWFLGLRLDKDRYRGRHRVHGVLVVTDEIHFGVSDNGFGTFTSPGNRSGLAR